jgi:hypothetical protein
VGYRFDPERPDGADVDRPLETPVQVTDEVADDDSASLLAS